MRVLLLLIVAAAPTAANADAPRLLTEQELAIAPVKLLTVAQLEREAARVEDLPTIAPGAALIGLGAVGVVLGSLLVVTNYQTVGPSGAWLGGPNGALGLSLGLIGLLLGSIGGVVLPFQMVHRSEVAQRRLEVLTQRASIRRGESIAPEQPGADAVARLAKLEERRPGFGGSIMLMAVGLPLICVGAYALSGLPSALRISPEWPIALTFATLGGGLIMEGLGLYSLLSRLIEKAEFDRRVREIIDAG